MTAIYFPREYSCIYGCGMYWYPPGYSFCINVGVDQTTAIHKHQCLHWKVMNLSGKLRKVWAVSAEEKKALPRTASSVDGHFPLLGIFCCGSLQQPTMPEVGHTLSSSFIKYIIQIRRTKRNTFFFNR
jgi:hypothetical protein